MKKYNYRSGTWCAQCKKEVYEFALVCPTCGSGYSSGLRSFETIRYVWVEKPVKWYSPSSWSGGHWEFEGIGKKIEGIDESIS